LLDKERIEEIAGELEPKIEKLKKSQNELALKKVILEKETQIQCQKMYVLELGTLKSN
jgi:hypothetical protein